MAVGSADGQGLRQIFELNNESAGKGTMDPGNPVDVDNAAPVDAPELIGIKLCVQLPNTFFD